MLTALLWLCVCAVLAAIVYITASQKRPFLRASLPSFSLALVGFVAQGAAFVGRGVFHQPVGFAARVALGQILGDGQPLRGHKKQSMAILVNLHVIAGADPRAMFDFFFFVGIEAARA